jgi:hypothetical protein
MHQMDLAVVPCEAKDQDSDNTLYETNLQFHVNHLIVFNSLLYNPS